ncbi:MAG: hypothetical protein R3236_09475, partial [Phycisphaeraceae bacterium]|nr:hypothetical protein [Phycisphaeraceae bacterium]
LSGREVFDIQIDDDLKPGQKIQVKATDPDSGEEKTFTALCRVDTPVEVEYYRNGGILHTVLRKLAMPDQPEPSDDPQLSDSPEASPAEQAAPSPDSKGTDSAPQSSGQAPASEQDPDAESKPAAAEPAREASGLDPIQINAKVKIFNFKKGDVAELDQYLEDPNCSEDTALLVYWSLEGPWHYTDEEAAKSPHGDLLIKLRDRILSGHYKPEKRLSFNPVSAMRVSLLQVMKLQNAGVDAKIMRQ